MAYWLKIEKVSAHRWDLRVVTTEEEATPLNLADAHEALTYARRDYPGCVWVTVPLTGDKYLIAGEAKPKPYAG